MNKRKSGVLMHISSLPNDYGIGKLGKESYDFVDWLEKAGQKIWQILPLSQTSFGDSPYQSFSIFAGNPYFISFETLTEEGLLTREDYASVKWCDDKTDIDYALIYNEAYTVLRKAFAKFKTTSDEKFEEFVTKNSSWLKDYALFMAIKDSYGGKAFCEWETPLKMRDAKAIADAEVKFADEILFWSFLQYKFYEQWFKLKKYANDKGIQIIGDIPIYTAYDSSDVWCSPELFQLDDEKTPIDVAGFPPDAFSKDGQLWGNPLYNWDKMKEQNYSWWVERMSFNKSIYDIVRIDHFIGFDKYYAIPFGDKTAHNGVWKQGPAYELFKVIKEKTGKDGIIAEDLGIITPSVRKMLKQCGYPGMKVLHFAFYDNGTSEYLPQNFTSNNCIVYTSTHDNDTTAGFISTLDRKTKKFCKDYLNVRKNSDIPNAFIEFAWKSTADTAITAFQDIIGLGSEARMNVPSTVGTNWKWRATTEDFTDEKAEYLKNLTEICNRS